MRFPVPESPICTLGTGLGQVLDKRFLVLAVFCKNFVMVMMATRTTMMMIEMINIH